MGNIELKIDGEVIVLTPQQTEQLKRAVVKETSMPAPKTCGNLTLSCKTTGKKASYPLMITSSCRTPASWGGPVGSYGKDFSLIELKGFIRNLKLYAAQIWSTATTELKNV